MSDTTKHYAVVNSTGRRFHIGTDRGEAIEVATRLEAQLRGVASAGAVGGATPTLADLPEHVVVAVDAPDREYVAEAIRQGVPTPGTPVGSNVTGNEVDERRAAELEARGDDADVAGAFGVDERVAGSDRESRVTDLEPRPEPTPDLETVAEPGEPAEVRERDTSAQT